MKTAQTSADVFIDLRRQRVRSEETSHAPFGRRRPRFNLLAHLPAIPTDGLFAFTLCVAMLFVQQAGTLSGVAMAALPLLYMALRRRFAGAILRTRWPLLLAPAFALLSTIWSEAPGISLKYSIELWLTAAAGIGLATAQRPTAVIKGLCLGFLLYLGLSFVAGKSTDVGVGAGGEAFVGLGEGKNMFADMAAAGALLSMTSCFIGVRQRSLFWTILGLAAAIGDAALMIKGRSAGATITFALGVILLLTTMLVSLAPRAVRATLMVLALASAGAFALAFGNLSQFLVSSAEQFFGKDPTLTGRTYLWYRAHDLIAAKPWQGTGYFAFWRQGNTDAEGLWQFAGITGREGFNFHNSLIELSVEIGYIGAAVFCIVAAVSLIALTRRFLTRPSIPLCFWITYFVCALVRAPTEAVGYSPFYYSTCFLFAAGAFGLTGAIKAHRRRGHVPQALRLKALYDMRSGRFPIHSGGVPFGHSAAMQGSRSAD